MTVHRLVLAVASLLLAAALALLIAGPTAPALHPDITTPSTTPPVIYQGEEG